ncbi:MAG: twin-arginine translocase TatA/TatE family subunit [Desulfovibrio sp.]|jgi:sec-independent protein translocase protein TatB|nr:twin-arginine translocase TatA/TatE family subunit [Desulfovibrio sp.]
MFGIGSTEFLVILLVALIVLGPKSLAGIARTMGKAMGEFRRISTDFQRTLNAEAAQEKELERKKRQAGPAGGSVPLQNAAAPQDRAEAGDCPNAMSASDAPPPPSPGSRLAVAVAKAGAEAEAAGKAAEESAFPGDEGKGSAV